MGRQGVLRRGGEIKWTRARRAKHACKSSFLKELQFTLSGEKTIGGRDERGEGKPLNVVCVLDRDAGDNGQQDKRGLFLR